MGTKIAIGDRFGRLTVIERAENLSTCIRWLCRCDCGKETTVHASSLARGNSRSCGCLQLETVTSHGESKGPEYAAWNNMRGRCLNSLNTQYGNYGGRGITICEAWLKFEAFIADMGKRPSRAHSLERRDVNGNYEPGNCHWATRDEQVNNKRTNVRVLHNGRSLTLAELSKESGIDYFRLRSRLKRGLSVEEALDPNPRWATGPRNSRFKKTWATHHPLV